MNDRKEHLLKKKIPGCLARSMLHCVTVLIFGCSAVVIFSQRAVSSLSEDIAVFSPSTGPLRSSVAASAPADLGPAFSAHTGYPHCWMPPGATSWDGRVQMNEMN